MNFDQLMKTPHNQMSAAFDALKSDQVQEFENQASALAVRAAFVMAYLGHRGAYGCGDHGHDAAKVAADKQVKKARRALGFTYP